jgi:hypothetical protein
LIRIFGFAVTNVRVSKRINSRSIHSFYKKSVKNSADLMQRFEYLIALEKVSTLTNIAVFIAILLLSFPLFYGKDKKLAAVVQ